MAWGGPFAAICTRAQPGSRAGALVPVAAGVVRGWHRALFLAADGAVDVKRTAARGRGPGAAPGRQTAVARRADYRRVAGACLRRRRCQAAHREHARPRPSTSDRPGRGDGLRRVDRAASGARPAPHHPRCLDRDAGASADADACARSRRHRERQPRAGRRRAHPRDADAAAVALAARRL
jgi:hypothetical protein